MALSKGMSNMEDLPDEIFAKILDLVPIREIFVLMRVSKRWAAACRFIARTRQSLSIGNYNWLHLYPNIDAQMRGWDWHRNRPTEPLDNITPANNSLVSDMMKSLNQMENITRLCVCGIGLKDIRPFIQTFAADLTMLEVDFTIRDVGSVVFPHLTHLKCSHFNAKTATAFPKLRELVIYDMDKREMQPDMRLPSLKRLIDIHPDFQQIRGFVQQNAADLEFLSVYKFKFDRSVVFRNLTQVSCDSMNVIMLRALPAITRLTVKKGVGSDFLKRLPVGQMLSLDIRLICKFVLRDHEKDEALFTSAAVISGMHNLKELTINGHQVVKRESCYVIHQSKGHGA